MDKTVQMSNYSAYAKAGYIFIIYVGSGLFNSTVKNFSKQGQDREHDLYSNQLRERV